ncbi:MAG: hypothetical protein ACM3L8_08225 [Verrucomicrobiota bacterium]
MKRCSGWRPMSGILLAGTMLFGCFAPVVYGVYKVYDLGNHQVVALTIDEKPEAVYKSAIVVAGERGFKFVKRDDQQMVFSGISARGPEATVKVTGLPRGESRLTITVEKGKDVKLERQEIVDAVLGVCNRFGSHCKEEKE